MLSSSRARDHPRVCGEHSFISAIIALYSGSSPRMRGAPANSERAVDVSGIIPAYAGSTEWGEGGCTACAGSSPRMRGALTDGPSVSLNGGIIPAYAGSTRDPPGIPRNARDHPRVCGEHRACHWRCRLVRGIIPAYAGSTLSARAASLKLWDHPRVCGEHLRISSFRYPALGSSPRMRGARLRRGAENLTCGIIPAYAGSTAPWTEQAARAWDHPRVCGEHNLAMEANAEREGSSPRMRGAPAACCLYSGEVGIIPAYAGSTS